MTINILNADLNDKSPVTMTEKEFWELFLLLRDRNKKLTPKEISIIADFAVGINPEKPNNNYKTYMKKIEAKGVSLEKRVVPNNPNIQINLIIDGVS